MTVALIAAAGSGERLGAGGAKALVELGGKTILQWSVEALSRVRGVTEIVVALPEGAQAPAGTVGVRGGAVRSESVRRALAAAGEGKLVMVHDAARPLVRREVAEAVIAAAGQPGVEGAVAATPVTDTIKRASAGVVTETLLRDELWAVQTPQVFRREALQRALAAPDEVLRQATDDAWLLEREGGRVVVVESDAENFKITTQLDLQLALLVLERRGLVGKDDGSGA